MHIEGARFRTIEREAVWMEGMGMQRRGLRALLMFLKEEDIGYVEREREMDRMVLVEMEVSACLEVSVHGEGVGGCLL